MNTMTVTVDLKKGEVAYFKIEFKKEDFFKVIEEIAGLTLEKVMNSKLWNVV